MARLSGRHLTEAVEYTTRAVAETAATTVKVDLDSATPQDFMRMSFLAAQWDTLGWAKFRFGDAESAEKFAHSAWNLSPNSVLGNIWLRFTRKLGENSRPINTATAFTDYRDFI